MRTGNDIKQESLKKHKKLQGKIAIVPKGKIKSIGDLSVYYTPGVGAVSTFVGQNKKRARDYTMKGNSVAVVSDGSAVLGLGNVGPYAALPVMEGKAMLFKTFANIDAFPIVLGTQEVDEVIATVKYIAPTFGGVNLEDIAAPRCFEIEERLKRELDIPVMHDDQHGTAIVVLAGLLNAAKVVRKQPRSLRIVIVGAGAAGTAIARLLHLYGVSDILLVDSKGIISRRRKDLVPYKQSLAKITNRQNKIGTALDASKGADVIIGVSGPKTIRPEHIRNMAKDPIVFALANPTPEILPEEAYRAGALVVATGRSDFPNQVNNALVFPGVFRGALDRSVRQITDTMKLRAAKQLAALVRKATPGNIIPPLFHKKVVASVASAIR